MNCPRGRDSSRKGAQTLHSGVRRICDSLYAETSVATRAQCAPPLVRSAKARAKFPHAHRTITCAYSAIEDSVDKLDCGDDVDAETLRDHVGLDRCAARDGACEPRMLA
eukprot:2807543-Pleurochrysis_carterae.AAC.1